MLGNSEKGKSRADKADFGTQGESGLTEAIGSGFICRPWTWKEEMNHKRRSRGRKEHWADLQEQVGGSRVFQRTVWKDASNQYRGSRASAAAGEKQDVYLVISS